MKRVFSLWWYIVCFNHILNVLVKHVVLTSYVSELHQSRIFYINFIIGYQANSLSGHILMKKIQAVSTFRLCPLWVEYRELFPESLCASFSIETWAIRLAEIWGVTILLELNPGLTSKYLNFLIIYRDNVMIMYSDVGPTIIHYSTSRAFYFIWYFILGSPKA